MKYGIIKAENFGKGCEKNVRKYEQYDKMYDEDPEAAEVFAERVGDICDRTDELSDDELRDELMDAYELIEDILNGVAY